MSSLLLFNDKSRALQADIVAVQSQVVYGSVGNSIAVPAIRTQRLERLPPCRRCCSAIRRTTTLSTAGRSRTSGSAATCSALQERDASCASFVQSPPAIWATASARSSSWPQWLTALRKVQHPDLLVHGRPGDRRHRQRDVRQAGPSRGLPCSTCSRWPQGITPNVFELEVLTGKPCRDARTAPLPPRRGCCQTRLKWVAITSAAGG